MARVLAFTPYAAWRIHTLYEATITRACRLRGAEVTHLLCDGVLSECDMYIAALSPSGRPFDLCARCQAGARAVLDEMGLPYEWLSRYIEPQERRDAFQWAQALQPGDFPAARFRGLPVGEWVTTSVVSYFRTFPIRLDDWHTVNVFRGFLHGAALASIGLDRALDARRPDAMLLLNGRLSVLRIAFNLARQRGIRVLVHERPNKPASVSVVENDICTSPVPFKQFWQDWADVPLSHEQLQAVVRWLCDRRYGRNQVAATFASPPAGEGTLRQALRLETGRRLVAVFTTATDEFAGDPERQGAFPSQEVWLEQVVDWVSGRPRCDLVIRVHPSLTGKAGMGIAGTQIEWFRALQARLPRNARLILPEEGLSSYDLMDAADLGLTYGSTAGLEMLALGKPVGLVPGFAVYDDVPGLVLMRDPGALPGILDEAMMLQPSRERRRHAFRCIYRYFFQRQLPFPLVSMVSLYESKLEYSTPEALSPGRDAGLDRICGFLLEGEPIFGPPSEPERLRSRAEEDAFLERLEQLPEPFRSRRRELEIRLRPWIRRASTPLRIVARILSPRHWVRALARQANQL